MTKHLVKPKCKYGCRFVQIATELWLCPHAAYGRLSYMMGAVEEGRRLLERHGGYDTVVQRVVEAENRLKADRLERKLEAQKRRTESVRYI